MSNNQNILLNTIPKDKREKFSALADNTQKRLLERVVDSLSEDGKKEFLNILENNDSSKMTIFLNEHIPNFLDWLEEEITKSRLN